MTTALTIDLEEILLETEIDSLPFASSNSSYVQNFIRAIIEADGAAVFVGKKDTYFPDPVSMTENEMEEFIDFWVSEQDRSLFEEDKDYQSRNEISSAVYDAAVEIDSEIIEKILAAIKQ